MAEEIKKQPVALKPAVPQGRNTDGFRPVRKGFGRKNEANDGFDTKTLDLARVTRVTGGGKRMSFRAVVIGGDQKGRTLQRGLAVLCGFTSH